jgi:membrane protein implicated in regulation of membrane protease activity
MNWWAWAMGGAILLGSELGFVSAQLYLVFIGAAAIMTGLTVLCAPSMPPSWQWALFSLLAIVSMLAFRARLHGRLHRRSPSVQTGLAGGELTLPQALSPGESCRAEHGGSFWTVCNDGQMPLAAGERVRIAEVRGLTLLVRPG